MGTIYRKNATRDDILKDRIEPQSFDSTYEPGLHIDTTTEEHQLSREDGEWVLWRLVHTIKTSIETGAVVEDIRWIACDILRTDPGYGWGYKDMDESMGPYFSSCPCDWFNLVPLPETGYAAQFRARCRAVQGVPEPQPELFTKSA